MRLPHTVDDRRLSRIARRAMIEFSAQINDPHCASSLVQAAVARTLFPGCDNDNAAPSSETFDDGGGNWL